METWVYFSCLKWIHLLDWSGLLLKSGEQQSQCIKRSLLGYFIKTQLCHGSFWVCIHSSKSGHVRDQSEDVVLRLVSNKWCFDKTRRDMKVCARAMNLSSSSQRLSCVVSSLTPRSPYQCLSFHSLGYLSDSTIVTIFQAFNTFSLHFN